MATSRGNGDRSRRFVLWHGPSGHFNEASFCQEMVFLGGRIRGRRRLYGCKSRL